MTREQLRTMRGDSGNEDDKEGTTAERLQGTFLLLGVGTGRIYIQSP